MKGYFKAGPAGDYTFAANGDDFIAVYINLNHGVPSVSGSPIIHTTLHSNSHNFYYDQYAGRGTAKATVTL